MEFCVGLSHSISVDEKSKTSLQLESEMSLKNLAQIVGNVSNIFKGQPRRRQISQVSDAPMEVLEQRQLLSATSHSYDHKSDTVTIEGSSGDDDVTVSNGWWWTTINVNGQKLRYRRGKVDKVVFHGNDGNDTFTNKTAIPSSAWGGKGKDVLKGGSGRDYLSGGSGYDKIYGNRGHDKVFGGSSGDYLNGGSGNDIIFGGTGRDVINGNDGHDQLYGQWDSDRLYGGKGDDYISGGSGHDKLYGWTGDDILRGNSGNDRLYGGDGDDVLYGHSGRDRLYGGAGEDGMDGGSGWDRYWSGPGDDYFFDATKASSSPQFSLLPPSRLDITMGIANSVVGIVAGHATRKEANYDSKWNGTTHTPDKLNISTSIVAKPELSKDAKVEQDMKDLMKDLPIIQAPPANTVLSISTLNITFG